MIGLESHMLPQEELEKVQLVTADGEHFALIEQYPLWENAEFIVKAVNSHDALLKWATWAYQELMEAWDSHDLPDEFTATLEKIHGRKKCLTNTE